MELKKKSAKVYFWDNALLAIPATVIVAFLLLYEPCDQECSDWDFVQDLLLDNGESETISRWNHAPSVRAVNGSSEEVAMLEEAVSEYHRFLSGTGYSPVFTRNPTADIEVSFLTKEKMRTLDHDFDVDEIDGFASWNIYDDDKSFVNVEIFVLTNLASGRKWGTTLHELGHGMGFIGHTDRYYSSLFHTEMGYGALSDNFTSDDRKAMRFLYEQLESGSDEASVRAAFNRHWVVSSN